jgi:hypothetical protein
VRDPFLHSSDEPAPLVPGHSVRYVWPEGDGELALIRSEVQEGGKGLFVVHSPYDRRVKVLIEAYYPEDIRPEYYEGQLDPMRKAEYGDGRLVCIAEVGRWVGEIPRHVVETLKRNNRNARSELKRKASAYDRRLEMDRLQKDEEEVIHAEYEEAVRNAEIETHWAAQARSSNYIGGN